MQFKTMLTATVLAAFTVLPGLSVNVDPAKFYTLSRDSIQYLDSTNSALAIQTHSDRPTLEAGDDKGVRFRFPNGLPGPVICEAHNDHVVGLDGDKWSTEVDGGKGTAAVAESFKQGIQISNGGSFIGAAADVASAPFAWNVDEIPGVPL